MRSWFQCREFCRQACFALVLFSVILAVVPASAQNELDSFDRTKFGLELGTGYHRFSTGTGVFGDSVSTTDEFGVGIAFAAEFIYRTGINVHIELFGEGWLGSVKSAGQTQDWDTFIFGGALRWYPRTSGFFIRGGFGGGVITGTLKDPSGTKDSAEFEDIGLMLTAGLGWEIGVTDRFASGPRVSAVFIDVGENVSSFGINLFWSFTWGGGKKKDAQPPGKDA
jgi:hypothetical protein